MKRTLEFVIDCGQENMDVRTFVRRYLGFFARFLTALKYVGEMLTKDKPVHRMLYFSISRSICLCTPRRGTTATGF